MRRGSQEDHHRTLDAVLMREQAPRRRVFARRGDGQLALRLQQLQRIRCPLRSGLFHDGQHLVLKSLSPM